MNIWKGLSLLCVLSGQASCTTDHVFDARTPFPPAARTIVCDGIIYRRLFGRELRRAIIGASFARSSESPTHCVRRPGEIVISSPDGQGFSADGQTYFQERDRVGPIQGTYEIEHDRFCTTVGSYPPTCRALYRSLRGGILEHYLLSGRPIGATPVMVSYPLP
jgi:hypothetical protein